MPEPILVLIAEDEEPIADALSYILEDMGYEVAYASNGRDALDLALARHPALIFTDLMMPKMDGAELIQRVREAASNGRPPPPIIVMTAAGMRQAQSAGGDAILRKPFDIDEVEQLAQQFLSDSHAPTPSTTGERAKSTGAETGGANRPSPNGSLARGPGGGPLAANSPAEGDESPPAGPPDDSASGSTGANRGR